MPFAENLGTGGGTLDAQYGSVPAANTNAPLLLPHTGTNYLYLSGVAKNYASTPDSAALDITGDIEIVVRVALDDVIGYSSGQSLVAKQTATNNRSYYLEVDTAGRPTLITSGDGTATRSIAATVALPFADGEIGWIKATRVAATGNTNFYVANDQPTEPTVWTLLGAADRPTAAGAIYSGNSNVEVGSRSVGLQQSSGRFYRAIVRDGIGGTVAFDANFSTGITSGNQTTFTESSTNAATVTINRSTSGRKAVAVVEPVWLLGTDDFFEVPDSDLLDFGPTDSFTVLASVRQWATPTSAARFVHKGGATGPVWRTGNYFATTTPNSSLLDAAAVNAQTITPAGPAAGTTAMYAMVVDRTAQTMTTFVDGAAGTPASIAGVGSVASASVMRIGATSLGAAFLSGEVSGVLVIRRALSAAEVGVIAGYYAQAPTIITQPVNVTQLETLTATFSVTAAADPLPSYQWERSTDGGLTFAPIVGATSSVLNVTGLQVAWSGYRYRCVATNIGGSVTSSAAVLTVSAIVLTNASSDVTAGGYRVVTWTSSGSIAVAGAPLDVEHLVVAGGGGGGSGAVGLTADRAGGGGGGGGLLTNVGGTALTLSATSHTVTVGAGGAGGINYGQGSDGSASSIGLTVTTVGGGGGGSGTTPLEGRNGGSGGGGGGGSNSVNPSGGTATSGQGNAGGTGYGSGSTAAAQVGGGGGGAGAAGQNAPGIDRTSDNDAGDGGNGLLVNITGTPTIYAGGGGGGKRTGTATPGTGGTGGGGNGGISSTAGTNGTDGLGGGGGGSATGRKGGDGIVIVRWAV